MIPTRNVVLYSLGISFAFAFGIYTGQQSGEPKKEAQKPAETLSLSGIIYSNETVYKIGGPENQVCSSIQLDVELSPDSKKLDIEHQSQTIRRKLGEIVPNSANSIHACLTVGNNLPPLHLGDRVNFLLTEGFGPRGDGSPLLTIYGSGSKGRLQSYVPQSE